MYHAHVIQGLLQWSNTTFCCSSSTLAVNSLSNLRVSSVFSWSGFDFCIRTIQFLSKVVHWSVGCMQSIFKLVCRFCLVLRFQIRLFYMRLSILMSILLIRLFSFLQWVCSTLCHRGLSCGCKTDVMFLSKYIKLIDWSFFFLTLDKRDIEAFSECRKLSTESPILWQYFHR